MLRSSSICMYALRYNIISCMNYKTTLYTFSKSLNIYTIADKHINNKSTQAKMSTKRDPGFESGFLE